MVIRLLTSLSGPDGAWAAGDLYACDEATARRMFEAGYAVPASAGAAPIVVETTMSASGPEQAMRPRARGRKG